MVLAQEGKAVPLNIKPVGITVDSITAPPLGLLVKEDSTQTDSIAPSKNKSILGGDIKYKAQDYVKISQKDQKIYLYNQAEIYYQDIELKAGVIVLDYIKNEVYAGRIKDSTGTYTQLPFFKQGNQEVIPDSIRFNFDTQKALIWNSRTEQSPNLGALGGADAMKVLAAKTKKENDSVYFMQDGRLTTAKDTLDPDYYIKIKKAKFVPGKKIIAGFSNMYLVDVPTPIALPFAYFPLTVGRTAGLIFPSITQDPRRGFALQNGGYYIPVGDYADLSLMGDYFTNGSYGIRIQSQYAVRYKFRGNVNFRFENQIFSQKGFSDYSSTRIFNLQVSHAQDTKSNPNSRFSASVNLGSSEYFTNSFNQINIQNNQNNTLQSSVTYSKTFPQYPSVNLNLTASHSQNTRSQIINMTLPTFQGSMERIYPFAKRDGSKKGLIKGFNMQYQVRAENRIQTTDTLFLTNRMFEDSRLGARHSIPFNTNFKVARYFSVSVGGNYEDVWTLETFRRGLDPNNPESNQEVVLDTLSGFDRYNRYNLSASIGTTLYGTFNFKPGGKIQAIRHVMRPQISWSLAPSFEQFYDTYIDNNQIEQQYSRFEGTLYGAPTLNRASTLAFTLQNTLEAKVRDKDSTQTEPKKVPILSNFNFSTSYNLEADSLKLAPIRMNGGTKFFENKLDVNFTGTFDPFAVDNNGRRINTLNVQRGGGLARFTNATLNLGFRLTSKDFEKNKEGKDPAEEASDEYRASSGGSNDDLFGFGFDNRMSTASSATDAGDENLPYRNKIPWDLNMRMAFGYQNNNRQQQINNASLMFSISNIKLTPKWDIRVSSGYDFVNQGFAQTQLGFVRNLGSFDLRFNWTPFGQFERWDFFIGISSSILQDLKYDKQSQGNIRR